MVELSVVVPVLDAGTMLAEQLTALARQADAPDFEVVVADNGSTDGCLDRVPEFAGLLSVRVVDAGDRRGAAHARNVGAAHAHGAWLAFCDADDVVDPGWLAGLWSAREEGVVVTGPCDVVRLNPEELRATRSGPGAALSLMPGPCGFLWFAMSCNLMVSAADFARIGGWDESLRYGEDVDLSWRAQLAGLTLRFAPGAVVHYRYRDSIGDTMRQVRRHAVSEVELFRRFRRSGARRHSVRETTRRYGGLLLHSPWLLGGRGPRARWCVTAASTMGWVEGSVRHRVLYL